MKNTFQLVPYCVWKTTSWDVTGMQGECDRTNDQKLFSYNMQQETSKAALGKKSLGWVIIVDFFMLKK